MLTFFIVLIGLSLLILGHEAGHFIAAKLFKLKVEEFGIGFPPRIFAWKKGETEYSVNWLPFGGFVKIAGENDHMDKEDIDASAPPPDMGRYFFSRPAWQRAIVLGAGVFFNFVAGWLLLTAVFAIGTPAILAIQEVQKDSPAAAAGLRAGDIIKGFTHSRDFTAFVQAHPNEEIRVDVLRNSDDVTVAVTPRMDGGVSRIGVGLIEGGGASRNIFQAAKEGFIASGQVARLTLQAFYLLIKNLFLHASLLEGVVGPVGIFTVAQQASQFGLIYLLQLLGFISVNLAVANLIPFPALDGGRLLLLVIEKIKGSPLSRKVELWLNGIGFALLIGIMALVTIRDIAHWF